MTHDEKNTIMNSKLYRCGWCGYPNDKDGHCLANEGLEKAARIINNYNTKEHTHLVHGDCCPNGYGIKVQVTRDMASAAGDPSMEGQWIPW